MLRLACGLCPTVGYRMHTRDDRFYLKTVIIISGLRAVRGLFIRHENWSSGDLLV